MLHSTLLVFLALVQMMNGRGQAISIVTLGALLIVVYLIAYSPWGNYRAVLHVLQRTNDFEVISRLI
jgi:hypothetical protein